MDVIRSLPEPDEKPRRVLVLHGGWPDHQPDQMATFAIDRLLFDCDVFSSSDLALLNPKTLANFDLLVLIWTFGELSASQEEALLSAVRDGLGFVAWHGAASAFLTNRAYKLMLGGQFVAHPGGDGTAYDVRFLGNDPLVRELEDVSVSSEQYYVLVDPAVKVLATTKMDGGNMEWISGVEMPVAWTRPWGMGRVFYTTLGHSVSILEKPSVSLMLRRAVLWASDPAPRFQGTSAPADIVAALVPGSRSAA
jgi:type 1 glutamine amidotransferase